MRDGERDDTLASHPPEQTQNQNRTEQEQIGVTRHALVEVLDEAALRARDDYGRLTTGKPYPRNRRGGWRFPTMWPPGHGGVH
jgi:hypothetical protein